MHVYLRGLCKIREEVFGCGGIPSVFHGVGRGQLFSRRYRVIWAGFHGTYVVCGWHGKPWKEGMLYSDDEEIAFTVENGMLTVSIDTESMVFERVKDAPEKMEVQNPEETTGTPTDDTEVSGTDLPQQ